jgi:hypothetical protein
MTANRKLKPSDIYDKTNIYSEKLEPIVRSLMAVCIAERMPMFVSVATKNTDEGTQYTSRVVLGTAPVRLSDNRIRSYILSLRKTGENELPPEVREAITVLEKYADSVKSVFEESKAKPAGIKLKDNLIDGYCSIAGGGDNIVV